MYHSGILPGESEGKPAAVADNTKLQPNTKPPDRTPLLEGES
jgi:hypothetical protein